jgi:hypothetical protein
VGRVKKKKEKKKKKIREKNTPKTKKESQKQERLEQKKSGGFLEQSEGRKEGLVVQGFRRCVFGGMEFVCVCAWPC